MEKWLSWQKVFGPCDREGAASMLETRSAKFTCSSQEWSALVVWDSYVTAAVTPHHSDLTAFSSSSLCSVAVIWFKILLTSLTVLFPISQERFYSVKDKYFIDVCVITMINLSWLDPEVMSSCCKKGRRVAKSLERRSEYTCHQMHWKVLCWHALISCCEMCHHFLIIQSPSVLPAFCDWLKHQNNSPEKDVLEVLKEFPQDFHNVSGCGDLDHLSTEKKKTWEHNGNSSCRATANHPALPIVFQSLKGTSMKENWQKLSVWS